MWVLDHLEDIDSDMSVFHRVDRAHEAMDGPLFFSRAERLAAYPGVMRARAIAAQNPTPGMNGGSVTKVSDEVMLRQLADTGFVDYEGGALS